MRTPATLAVAAGLLLLTAAASGQSLSLKVDSEELYANLPFILSLSASGFDETPQPEPPELAIANAQVTYLGVSPNVAQNIQIVNGRRSEWREVTFVYRWRVQVAAPGRYEIPPLTVTQAAKSATHPNAAFSTQAMEMTSDMIVRMILPERPVYVGETFDAAVEWLLTRNVERHEFVVPLFADHAVRVAPAPGGGQTVAFAAGAANVELPMSRGTVHEAGEQYTRLRFAARVTALAPGTIDLPPVRVAARLEAGSVRDAFGFRRTRTALFQAEGRRRRLTVRPLPEADRPPGFVNAVGRGFSIAVRASRSVVQVGDPIELAITVRGDGALEGLSLPPLAGAHALPPALFSVPSAPPFGTLDAANNAKTFDVTVRVLSAEAREVPAIALPYFDPVAGAYAIATSQPIALSVETGAVIGAADVAAGAGRDQGGAARPAPRPPRPAAAASVGTLLGADMSLSDRRLTLTAPWGAQGTAGWLFALYAAPLGLAGAVAVWRATEARRGRRRRVARALGELRRALDATEPAKHAAPRVVRALNALAAALGLAAPPRAAVMDRLETTAFDPGTADAPLDAETIAQVHALAAAWRRQSADAAAPAVGAVAGLALAAGAVATFAATGALAREAGAVATLDATGVPAQEAGAVAALDASGSPAQEAGAVVTLDASGAPARKAGAEAPPDSATATALDAARDVYRQALEETDRVRRTRLFAEAEERLRGMAMARLDAPELLTDWGNAALGAGDRGRATLAWRRALAAHPGHDRAARNLDWLRERAPSWLPRPAAAGALDSFLAWRDQFSAQQWHWVGAGGFALAVLMATPWSRRRTAKLRRLAVLPLAAWGVALAAATLGDGQGDAAVVLADGTTLRSADSAGAPPTFAHALPAATEVTVLEERDAWVRIALADGTRGWLPARALARVRPSA